LDVVVKQAIRELIRQRNQERGTTVFLTSHDPSDIEHLCHRAVVIDRGSIVLDSSIENMKSDFLGEKRMEVRFHTPQSFPERPGVRATAEDRGLRLLLTVDTHVCPIGKVIEQLSALGSVLDITVSDPPMEDIIASIFRKEAAS